VNWWWLLAAVWPLLALGVALLIGAVIRLAEQRRPK
jgi:hypothetical protein